MKRTGISLGGNTSEVEAVRYFSCGACYRALCRCTTLFLAVGRGVSGSGSGDVHTGVHVMKRRITVARRQIDWFLHVWNLTPEKLATEQRERWRAMISLAKAELREGWERAKAEWRRKR